MSILRRERARSGVGRRAATALAAASLCLAPAVSASAHGSHDRGETFYVATDGDDAASGSRHHPWATLAHAQEMVEPGDTVLLRDGVYAYDDAVRDCASQTDQVEGVLLTTSGTADRPITYAAYKNETPVLDFSGIVDDCRIKGVSVVADYLVLEGLEVTGVRQNNTLNNESWGIWVDGSHNVFDQLNIHHNMGAGLFIQDGAGNLVRDSDAHDNYDPYSRTGAGQNADGFGSHTNTPSDELNVFEGCRAWNNADDGFDFISSSSPVAVTHSWAWHNGYIYGTDELAAAGNGTGFKLGGYGGLYDPNPVDISISFSVAFDNTLRGFYANHHPAATEVYNNTAFDNGVNYNMRGVNPDGTPASFGILRNNVSFGSGQDHEYMDGVDSAYNSWDLGLELTDDDFLAVSQEGWDAPRERDGSMPWLPLMRPAPGGQLVDAGVDVGFGYRGDAPDLGAFELQQGRNHR